MRAFFGEQGRGRAFIRERRSSEKEPFLDGNYSEHSGEEEIKNKELPKDNIMQKIH